VKRKTAKQQQIRYSVARYPRDVLLAAATLIPRMMAQTKSGAIHWIAPLADDHVKDGSVTWAVAQEPLP
jgi:hypothetical protein